jgi:Synergist-CTERM protein sorting domain-containing protein
LPYDAGHPNPSAHGIVKGFFDKPLYWKFAQFRFNFQQTLFYEEMGMLNTDALIDLIAVAEVADASEVEIVIVKDDESLAKLENLTEEQKEILRGDENIREVYDIESKGEEEEDDKKSGGGCDAGFDEAGLAIFALGIALAVKRGKRQY